MINTPYLCTYKYKLIIQITLDVDKCLTDPLTHTIQYAKTLNNLIYTLE